MVGWPRAHRWEGRTPVGDVSPADDLVQPSAGTVVRGRYALEHLLARGGMGAVWRAADLVLERPVAVKFMDPRSAESPDWRARFEREAKAAARLRTPHVVQVFDHGVESGAPFIVMELLEGEDLGRRLRRLRRLDVRATATIVVQAARALRRAHDEGILHRDLKPQNVFLARCDDEEVVKLLDFGVAKILGGGRSGSLGGGNLTPPSGTVLRPRTAEVSTHAADGAGSKRVSAPPADRGHADGDAVDADDEHQESEVTRTGELLGSPQYMSPEQARGLRDIDARSDLWSLSVIAYRALTGQQPFVGQGVGDVIYRICSEPIAPPSTLVPELPKEVDAFFERALARAPAQRFQSAAELAAAFAEATAQPQPMSLPPPPSGSAQPSQPPAEAGLASPFRAEPGSSGDPSPSTPTPGSLGTPSPMRLHGTSLPTPMPPSAVTFAPPAERAAPAPATRRLLAAAVGAFSAIVALGVLGLRWRTEPVAPGAAAPPAPVEAEPTPTATAAPPPPVHPATPSEAAIAPAATSAATASAAATADGAPAASAPTARPLGPAGKKKTDWGY
jgi:eukaryotic-like serine/threonine-protein kinase